MVIKCSVSFVDFEEMRYDGQSIENIMDDQGEISHLTRTSTTFVFGLRILCRTTQC